MTRLNPLYALLLVTLSYVAGFYVLDWAMTTDNLIVLLNGLYIGSIAALAIVYTPSGWRAIKGEIKYVEVRQFLLGLFMLWAAMSLTVLTSTYLRAADLPATALTSTAWARWTAIFAAVLQVYAPDPGLGIFYGRDRKVISLSLAAGGVIALFAIWAQDVAVLSQRFGLLDRIGALLPW